MSQQWTEELWNDTLRQLYDRAASDQAFRNLCLADSDAAIKEISGIDAPRGTKVRFVEENTEHVMVLPRQAAADEELSEAELESVAGGIVLGAKGWTDWRASNSTCCGPITKGTCFGGAEKIL